MEVRSQHSQVFDQTTATPNPADGFLKVNLGKSFPEGSKLVFTGLDGKVLLIREVSNISEISLDISAFRSGVYLVTIYSPDAVPISIKVVIFH